MDRGREVPGGQLDIHRDYSGGGIIIGRDPNPDFMNVSRAPTPDFMNVGRDPTPAPPLQGEGSAWRTAHYGKGLKQKVKVISSPPLAGEGQGWGLCTLSYQGSLHTSMKSPLYLQYISKGAGQRSPSQ